MLRSKGADRHLLLVGQALQQEVVHFEGARWEALEEPRVRFDLVHRHAFGRAGHEHASQDIEAISAHLHILCREKETGLDRGSTEFLITYFQILTDYVRLGAPLLPPKETPQRMGLSKKSALRGRAPQAGWHGPGIKDPHTSPMS